MIEALSRQEMRAVTRLVRGMNCRQIAADIGITRSVAKNYLRRAARKVGAHGQSELASIATARIPSDAEEGTLP
jgi:DNA-binding CsgD family transcriptional regulator